MNHLLQDYSQRSSLHHEVHARPPIALWPEERICSQAFLVSGQDEREVQLHWISQVMASTPEASRLASSPGYKLIQMAEPPARLLLRWELHGEFSTLCLFHQASTKDDSHDWSTSRQLLLQDFQLMLKNLGHPIPENGFQNRIAASDLIIRPGPRVDDAAALSPLFSGNTLIGSSILGSMNAQVWTDLQLDSSGFVRLLVQHQGIGSRQAGRVAQRLIDTDTYRMMAMLSLPNAKGLSEPLRRAENELSHWANAMAQHQTSLPENEATPHEQLLNGLSSLASKVEDWISIHGLRFTASEAYSELVRRALVELKETPITGVQTLSEFMDRRFEPAMRTCRWTQRRLRELSDRVSRTTQILRTRIEFMTERQNQALLASMNRRARLQLKLQQTVEGLSLVVLTYYSVGLIQYLAKGVREMGFAVPIDLITALAVPIIAIALLLALRQARKRFSID